MAGDHLERLSLHQVTRYGDRTRNGLNASGLLRAELFAGWVGRGQRLLDLGCGSGQMLERYAEGNRVTAVDADRAALEGCGRQLGLETTWGDFSTALPFADGAFDVVVAGETLEHMPYPALFLAEIRRVLADGGVFVGSSPNAYRYRSRLDVLRGLPIDRDPTHLQCFSMASLRATLARHCEVEALVPVRGRWAHRWPSLFAHYLAWRARRPA